MTSLETPREIAATEVDQNVKTANRGAGFPVTVEKAHRINLALINENTRLTAKWASVESDIRNWHNAIAKLESENKSAWAEVTEQMGSNSRGWVMLNRAWADIKRLEKESAENEDAYAAADNELLVMTDVANEWQAIAQLHKSDALAYQDMSRSLEITVNMQAAEIDSLKSDLEDANEDHAALLKAYAVRETQAFEAETQVGQVKSAFWDIFKESHKREIENREILAANEVSVSTVIEMGARIREMESEIWQQYGQTEHLRKVIRDLEERNRVLEMDRDALIEGQNRMGQQLEDLNWPSGKQY